MVIMTANLASGQVIVGHRGASYDAPENTLAAFREAFVQGADGIEADFYFTTDDQIVCIHDADTLRTGGQKKVVGQSSLAELQSLEYGSWLDSKFAGEPLPTFKQVMQCVPDGKLFVIELKTGPEIVPLLKSELDAITIGKRKLLIIAFDAATVAACKTALPNVRVHWLTSFKEKAGEWSPSLEQVVKTVRDCGADGVGLNGSLDVVDADFVAGLQTAGITEFHVWTIDDAERAKKFAGLGAFGITTNRPEFIRQQLANDADR